MPAPSILCNSPIRPGGTRPTITEPPRPRRSRRRDLPPEDHKKILIMLFGILRRLRRGRGVRIDVMTPPPGVSGRAPAPLAPHPPAWVGSRGRCRCLNAIALVRGLRTDTESVADFSPGAAAGDGSRN